MTSAKIFITLTLAVLILIALSVAYKTPASQQHLPDDSFLSAEFGGVSLRLELATTSEARDRGLGGRSEIQSDYGMLFVFPEPGRYGFWMKDTLVPLDIYWLDDKGQVLGIARDVATSTYPHVLYPPAPVRYVLETSAGFARTHGIATGTLLQLKNR